MPSATLSRMARMRSPLCRSSSSARRRSMNWPIWLPMPAARPAKHVGLPVHPPELARGPAEGLANAAEHLGGRFGPRCRVGQWTGHGELNAAKAFGHPALTDVVDERDKIDARRGARRGGYGDFDRKLMAVAMKAGHLDGLAQEPALTGLDEASQTSLVGVAVATRNDRAGQGPAQGFIVGPAEDLLRLTVPAGDQASLIRADDGAWRGVDDDLEPLL